MVYTLVSFAKIELILNSVKPEVEFIVIHYNVYILIKFRVGVIKVGGATMWQYGDGQTGPHVHLSLRRSGCL